MKTAVFDFDGTLADTEGLLFETAQHLLGRALTKEDISQYRILRDKEFLEYLGVGKLQALFLYKKGKKYFERRLDSVTLFDGVVSMLEDLSDDCKVGVLSKNDKEIIRPILERENVAQHIEFIEHSSFMKSKYRTLLGVSRSYQDVVYVGDQVGDIEAAQNCDIPSIGVTWGHHAPEFLEEYEPDALVDSVDALHSALQSLCDRKSPSS